MIDWKQLGCRCHLNGTLRQIPRLVTRMKAWPRFPEVTLNSICVRHLSNDFPHLVGLTFLPSICWEVPSTGSLATDVSQQSQFSLLILSSGCVIVLHIWRRRSLAWENVTGCDSHVVLTLQQFSFRYVLGACWRSLFFQILRFAWEAPASRFHPPLLCFDEDAFCLIKWTPPAHCGVHRKQLKVLKWCARHQIHASRCDSRETLTRR